VNMDWWLILGFSAQGLFFMRFAVQWFASERAGTSIFPTSFWYFSLAGTALLLVYSIHRRDAVFIIGQCLATLIYARNLYFIKRRPATTPDSVEDD
jgi:lipid-A-disaccharide synthase-like uncharacterized protein